jgi:TonB-linked SusC/RagA family outer membrane protein
MKKNVKNVRYRYGGARNLLKKMKLFVAFFFGGLLAVSANSYSQQTKLSLKMNSTTVREVFKQIEEKSEFIFFYNEDYIDVDRKVNINAKEERIESILDEVLRGTRNTYKIYDRQIVILSPGMKELPPIMNARSDVQQKRDISGEVKDVNGLPLPGVSVAVKGTTLGTITDSNGQYRFSVTGAKILIFSFVGMKSQEISVEGRSTLNVVMEEEAVGLEEVVAVGYGVQKKANLSGAVSSVNFQSEALASRPGSNVSSALSGMSSGIRVQQVNGLPSDNSSANINIRGTGSLNAGSAPLVIIDGQVADFNSVSSNDVASVSILKDAASAAIYGSRASNGVILITTKSGQDTNGKITFNYSNYIGKNKYTNKEDLVTSTADYMTFQNMVLKNSNLPIKYTQEYIDMWREGSKTDPIYYPNCNWWDAITKENIVMSHHFSASGGTSKIRFYTGIEYFDDDGLVPNTGYKRINFKNNLEYKVNDWLKIGNNISTVNSNAEPGTIDAAFQWFRATTPAIIPKYSDGRYGSGQLPGGEGGENNVLASVESMRGETEKNQLQAKIFAVLTPLKGLVINASYYNDTRQTESWSGNQPVDRWNFQTNQIGIDKTTGTVLSLTNGYSRSTREIVDLYTDYTRVVGNHNFHALAGYNQEYYISKSFSATKTNLLSYDTPVLDAAASNPSADGTASDFAMRSYFGRLSYNFKNKYLFEANGRYDGSSRFSPSNRWGFFPSFSAGWVMSEEKFWRPNNIATSVKLRASWGQLGNSGIGNYEWQNFYAAANYILNNIAVQGLRFNAFGNSGITWETTDVTNIGADITLFRSLNLVVNYYNKLTHNILATTPIPYVNGGITSPRTNSAQVRNSGLETEVRYSKKLGQVSINMGGNFSYNKNRIEKYKGSLIEPQGTAQAWTEGQPIGAFWVREVDHIVKDASEIQSMVANGYTFFPSTPGAGDFLYKDQNNDKIINDDDRTLKGNPIPLFTYGGDFKVEYKNFDFSMYFDGVGGWDRYLSGSVYSLNHMVGYQIPKGYLNAWTSENPTNTKIPIIYSNNDKNNQLCDYYLKSAAYLKIRSIQLGYNVPSTLLHVIDIDRLRVFVNLENYFTFTKWPTQDPEVQNSDYDQTYPLSKTISFGLSVSL